ncbi:MAG: cryptochrome/photolyase family protein [Pseudomonadota bacterium]
MVKLVLVLGDQLSPNMAALKAADKDTDVVVMAEVGDEASYVPHHPKKIAFIFASMRKFAQRLRDDGWTVEYKKLDQEGSDSICGELIRHAEAHGADSVIATEPGEFRLIQALQSCPLKVEILEDDRFVATHKEFEDWAEGRKQLRMEYFYRDMRRKTDLLMDGDKPEGGKWNFDHDNRKPGSDDLFKEGPLRHEPDAVTREVLDLVAARFDNNFGDLEPFWFATDPEGAEAVADYFIEKLLPTFGDYQDAMVANDRFLYHSLVSLYIHVGLLDALEICRRVQQAYRDGHAPINAAEGYIRQIIGWREFMRGIYFLEGPDYAQRNVLEHTRDLPGFYWSGQTDMACLAEAITATKEEGYAHHIQRLMVTGNFALLAGINPQAVAEWYLAVYVDAYEWVEAPNVIGMSQFADGGIVGSKPYVSSGAYINKMGDYCKGCHYSVSKKTGEGACPFNLLYWHFLMRHRDRFAKNPRMAQMYRTWDRMADDRKETVLREGDAFLDQLDAASA